MASLIAASHLPYIIHPMEAAVICASITDDEEVLAAAVLHDVLEDAGVTADEVEALFGGRVAAIVAGDSENKREGLPPAETWKVRKVENFEHITGASDPGVRIWSQRPIPNPSIAPEDRPQPAIRAMAPKAWHVKGVGDGFPLVMRAVFRPQLPIRARRPPPTRHSRHGAKALAQTRSWGRFSATFARWGSVFNPVETISLNPYR